MDGLIVEVVAEAFQVKRIVIVAFVMGALACGSSAESPSAGNGGSTGGDAASLAGAGGGRAGSGTNAGDGGGPIVEGGAGAGQAGRANEAGVSTDARAEACSETPHERPTPAVRTRDFASIAGPLAGVYRIDAAFDHDGACSSMCAHSDFDGHHFLNVASDAAPTMLDITSCETAEACASDKAVHYVVGRVDQVKSDQILSSQRTQVRTPQDQKCTGATVDVWLSVLAAGAIRVDVQRVEVAFPATIVNGTPGCDSADVDMQATGKACNRLIVIDATKQ